MPDKYSQAKSLIIAIVIVLMIISLGMCIRSLNCKKRRRRSTANIIIPVDHIIIENITVENAVQYDETKDECVFTDAVAIQIPEVMFRV